MLGKIMAVAVLGWLSAMALNVAPPYTGPYPLQEHDHAAPMISWRLLASRPKLSVLFIGNSFTFTHDIPAQVANLASGDAHAPVQLEISASTIPGGTLKQACDKGDALKLLQSRRFDVVVLQDWSIWPFRDEIKADTYDAVGRWANAARQAGARPVLYETWADKADSESYQPDWPYAGMSPASAQAAMTDAVQTLAATYQLPIVDVGGPFIRLANEPGAPELYGSDSHHPSVAGAFLSAAVLYHGLTGREPSGSTYQPAGLDDVDRNAIVAALAKEN